MECRHVVSDVDGCLTAGRGRPIDLTIFERLRDLNTAWAERSEEPWLLLVTARPQPYLEAILQLIGDTCVGIFEWGCGMFRPRGYETRFHPSLEGSIRRQIGECRLRLGEFLIDSGLGFLQAGKEVAITVYPWAVGEESVERLRQAVVEWLGGCGALADRLRVHKTSTFVNVLPAGIDKRSGVLWMLEATGIEPGACLAVGDGADDLPFLEICGASGAPENAAMEVKRAVDYCSPYPNGRGLLDCILRFRGSETR